MFQLPELGLLSLAMPIPLISGGLNLAIIATANQAALLMAWILTTQMPTMRRVVCWHSGSRRHLSLDFCFAWRLVSSPG